MENKRLNYILRKMLIMFSLLPADYQVKFISKVLYEEDF